MRAPLFALCLPLFACSSGSSSDNASEHDASAASSPRDPTVRFAFRTDLAPGREFDSYQLELGKPGSIARKNDCSTKLALVTREPVARGDTRDFGDGIVLATKKPEDLPLEARVLLCRAGEPVGALYRQVALAGDDAGSGNVTYVSFVDAGSPLNAPMENAIDIVFTIPRDYAATCPAAPPACVERLCSTPPILIVPHDDRCEAGQMCDLTAGCVAPD